MIMTEAIQNNNEGSINFGSVSTELSINSNTNGDYDSLYPMTKSDSLEFEENGVIHVASEVHLNRSRTDYIRQRYILYLGHAGYNFRGYIPDILTIVNPDGSILRNNSSRLLVGRVGDYSPLVEEAPTRRNFFPSGTMLSSLFNLTSATLGAGVLSLPFAFLNAGFIFGSILLILFAILSRISCNYLIRTIDYSNLKTYEELTLSSLNKKSAIVAQLSIIAFCFGTSVAYLVTIADIITLVVDANIPEMIHWWQRVFFSRAFLSAIVLIFILLPLSLAEKVGELRFTSFLGVASIVFLVFVILFYFIILGSKAGISSLQPFLLPRTSTSIIRASSILIFAFTCQPNLPAVYHELNERSPWCMKRVATGSVSLCLLIYIIMGVSGMAAFQDDTKQNILINLYPLLTSHWYLFAAFVAVTFAIIFAYPLNIFPCRFSLEMLIFLMNPNLNPERTKVFITVGTVLFTYVFSIIIPNISVVFELIGSTSGSFVCFILPGFFFLKLIPGPLYQKRKIKALLVIILGTIFGIIGTVMAIIDASKI